MHTMREGTAWMYKVVHRIENGMGKPEDMDLLNSVLGNIMGRTICALGDAAALTGTELSEAFR
jgi:NADH-quinone oxidoreductase subunit F